MKKPQIIAEPIGRNTAPAIGLAAFLLVRNDPNAVLGLFPSDHVIEDADRFRKTLKKGVELAAARRKHRCAWRCPTRAETGYGYIEAGAASASGALQVRRFTEKPLAPRSGRILASRKLLLE